MGWFSSSSFTALLPLLLFFLFIFASSLALDHHNPPLISVVDIKRPVLDVTPSVPLEHSAIHGVKDSSLCERVQVKGIPRLKLWSYASSFHVSLAPSAAIPEKLHSKIHVCFHRNNSLGWCQCGKHEGRSVQKGIWSAVMSPYETRYVDVRINGQISGSVTVALEEDFQQWRLICLVLGLALLLLAPIISSRVPYSMAIGVFVVIIFLLFLGMESLLTGGKYIFYLTICGSMLQAGSFLLCQFYLFVNSILQSLGMSEEMQNPVAVLVRPGIILFLAGAPSGYLFVRIISRENGTGDAGVAQFVKCALRIIGIIFIWQSTIDPPLAVGALVICGALCIKCETSVNDSSKQWFAWSYSPVRDDVCPKNGLAHNRQGEIIECDSTLEGSQGSQCDNDDEASNLEDVTRHKVHAQTTLSLEQRLDTPLNDPALTTPSQASFGSIPHARIDHSVETELKFLSSEGVLRVDYVHNLVAFLSACPTMRIPEGNASLVRRGFLYSALGEFLAFVRITPLSFLFIHALKHSRLLDYIDNLIYLNFNRVWLEDLKVQVSSPPENSSFHILKQVLEAKVEAAKKLSEAQAEVSRLEGALALARNMAGEAFEAVHSLEERETELCSKLNNLFFTVDLAP